MIKKGSKIKIKNSLHFMLNVLNYNTDTINYISKKFSNTEQIVEDVWYNGGQFFVVVDKCCDIPIQACEEIK